MANKFFALPAGTPKNISEAYRQAVRDTFKDPEFAQHAGEIVGGYQQVIGDDAIPIIREATTMSPEAWNWLDAWLHPSLVDRLLDSGITADALVERGFSVHAGHMAGGTVLGLMGAALGIGALGIAIAWFLYRNGPSEVVDRWATGSGKDTYKLALNKFYVDEIYEAIILKPFRWVAKVLYEFADKFVIDFLIGSAADLSLLRTSTSLVGMLLLLVGLAWETR